MATPQLPEVIEVGPYRYTVSGDELARLRIEHVEAKQLDGHTDHGTQCVHVNTAQAADQIRDTLLHETLHALGFLSGLSAEWGFTKEEEIVRRLSPLLLDVLRRNPALVAYLLAP